MSKEIEKKNIRKGKVTEKVVRVVKKDDVKKPEPKAVKKKEVKDLKDLFKASDKSAKVEQPERKPARKRRPSRNKHSETACDIIDLVIANIESGESYDSLAEKIDVLINDDIAEFVTAPLNTNEVTAGLAEAFDFKSNAKKEIVMSHQNW